MDIDTTVAETALDLVGIAVLAINADRDVLYANRAAHALLSHDAGLATGKGRLRLPAPADAALVGILRSATKRGWFQVPRRNRRPILARVMPVAAGRGNGAIPPSSFLLFVDDVDRAEANAIVPALRALYGLTEAEARVASLVGCGLPPLDAAGALGVSEATARTQLKQVFVKLGISRQSDLVTAVLRVHYIEPIS